MTPADSRNSTLYPGMNRREKLLLRYQVVATESTDRCLEEQCI
jgi:hypothetical protein